MRKWSEIRRKPQADRDGETPMPVSRVSRGRQDALEAPLSDSESSDRSACPGATSSVPVFIMELPLDLAPTLNQWANYETWRRQKIKGEINTFILLTLKQQGYDVRLPVGDDIAAKGRRRIVVTRHSSRRVDELAVDILGGKACTDCLVRAKILMGDSEKWLERVPQWERAKPGEGFLSVEVYDCE